MNKQEIPVKLSNNQFKEWQENASRIEIEEKIVKQKLAVQIANKNTLLQGFQIACTCKFVSNDDDLVKTAKLISEKLKIEGAEYKAPTKALNLV